MSQRWLIVTGDFTPLGGMDAANWGLAAYLGRTARADLVTHRAWPDLLQLPGITVHNVWRPFRRHLLGEPFLDRAGRRWARALGNDGLRVVVNGGNCHCFDVNWVHYVHGAYIAPPPAGLLRRTKDLIYRARRRARERHILGKSRVVVCNSKMTARHVIECAGVSPDRVRVVYYGCDPARFAAVTSPERQAARRELGWEDCPWVVFVGALGDARKGFDTLYAAWLKRCRHAGWDAQLAVVGRGAELPLWEARAKADGVAKQVRFLGFRDDVPRILAAADLMVHPARYEAYGLGVQEALCRGLPVLVSAAAGVAERYPPELADWLLTDPNDADELADRLQVWRSALESWPSRMTELAAALRGRAWDDMAADFVAAVES